MGLELLQPAGVELALELRDAGFEDAALDGDAETADAEVEQLLVGPGCPLFRRGRAVWRLARQAFGARASLSESHWRPVLWYIPLSQ